MFGPGIMQKSEIFDLQKFSSWLHFNSNGRSQVLSPSGYAKLWISGQPVLHMMRMWGFCTEMQNLTCLLLKDNLIKPKMLKAWKNMCAVRGKRAVHWMLKSNLIIWNSDKSFSACRVQFSSVAQSCLALCDPVDYNTPGLPVHHRLLEFTQAHVHWVGGAMQPFCLPKDPDIPALPQWR